MKITKDLNFIQKSTPSQTSSAPVSAPMPDAVEIEEETILFGNVSDSSLERNHHCQEIAVAEDTSLATKENTVEASGMIIYHVINYTLLAKCHLQF